MDNLFEEIEEERVRTELRDELLKKQSECKHLFVDFSECGVLVKCTICGKKMYVM